MDPSLLEVYKCAREILPRARNAIFERDSKTNNIRFLQQIDEVDRNNQESGHIINSKGDSGSPLWIPGENGNAQIIAIMTMGFHDHNEADNHYEPGINFPGGTCRNIVTKITEDIITWAFQKHTEHHFRIPGIWE